MTTAGFSWFERLVFGRRAIGKAREAEQRLARARESRVNIEAEKTKQTEALAELTKEISSELETRRSGAPPPPEVTRASQVELE